MSEWRVRRPGPFLYAYWLISCAVRVVVGLMTYTSDRLWSPHPRPTADGHVGNLQVRRGREAIASTAPADSWVLEVRTDALALLTIWDEKRSSLDVPAARSVVVRPRYAFRRSTLAHTPWVVQLRFANGDTAELSGRWWVLCHAARLLGWPPPSSD